MGKVTKIAWADSTWNPWWGCSKVSPGCQDCYADSMARQYGHDVWGPGKERRPMGEAYWSEPHNWDAKAAAATVGKDSEHWIVFAGDMCDIFDDEGHADARERMWKLIRRTSNVRWLLLTKLPKNFTKYLPTDWYDRCPNVWLGVTVDDRKHGYPRVDSLRETPAKVRYLSCEPLLEDISDIDLTGIDWVIVGGEPGPGSRAFDIEWARSLRTRCAESNTAFVMKQLGQKPLQDNSLFIVSQKTEAGKRDIHGMCPEAFPADLHVMQWPDSDEDIDDNGEIDGAGTSLESLMDVMSWFGAIAAADEPITASMASSAYSSIFGLVHVLDAIRSGGAA